MDKVKIICEFTYEEIGIIQVALYDLELYHRDCDDYELAELLRKLQIKLETDIKWISSN